MTGPTTGDLVAFAEAVKTSAIVPAAYRQWRDKNQIVHIGDPSKAQRAKLGVVSEGEPRVGDIVVCCSLGAAMGMTPAESLTRINVIGGRPCASAELLLSRARQAGHKVRITSLDPDRDHPDDPGWRVVIIRADDPDFEFVTELRLSWARQMGYLGGKRNQWGDEIKASPQWLDDPLNMLRHRATSRAIRAACPEVLFGVVTEDEAMSAQAVEAEPRPVPASVEVVRDAIGAGSASSPVEAEVVEAEVIDDTPTVEAEGPSPAYLRGCLGRELKRLGHTDPDEARAVTLDALPDDAPHAGGFDKSSELTPEELAHVVAVLSDRPAPDPE